jgi:hypothetical protein
MDQQLKDMIDACENMSINEHYEGEIDFDAPRFAGMVAQAVLDQLVADGVLGTDGTAYQDLQKRFGCK